MKYVKNNRLLLTIAVLGLIGFFTKNLFFSENSLKPQVSAQSSSDWPQLQHDSANTGYINLSVNPPYNISWRWHPESSEVSISGKVQPVIAGGIMCVGFYDGKMYCLDAETGQERWNYQTSGPILHTAAIFDNKVIFSSQDGAVYAVGADTGQLIWKYQTKKGIQNAPCINNNTVYIGSGDGYFYAISAINGQLKWSYDSGYPVLTSAACAGDKIYFGNQGLYAFALQDSGDHASLFWKRRLRGQSMAGYWPVVSASNNLVIFRTQPLGGFHEILGAGDSLLDQAGNPVIEQQRIIDYLDNSGSKWKTFWTLDINTGEEKYTAPILYTAGEGTIPIPPVIDEVNNRAWVVWRTKYSIFYTGGVRSGIDLGKLNLNNGQIGHFSGPEIDYIHLIGDETSILSAQQNALLISARGTLSAVDLNSETSFAIVNSLRSNETDYSNGNIGPFAYDNGWSKGDILGGGGQGGGLCAAASIANNKIYWVARYGLVVAIE